MHGLQRRICTARPCSIHSCPISGTMEAALAENRERREKLGHQKAYAVTGSKGKQEYAAAACITSYKWAGQSAGHGEE